MTSRDAASSLESRTALILYGSETGNAHDVADELGRLTQQHHFTTLVLDLDSVQLRDLLKFSLVIFVVSTTGQGEFPQNARALWKALLSGALKPGVFRRLRFTSFGLGDSSYPRFNVAHRMLHGRLLQLGARTFCERGEGNEQHPEGHSAGLREWLTQVKTSLSSSFPLPQGSQPLPDDVFIEPSHTLVKLDSIEDALNGLAIDKSESMPSAKILPIRGGFIADVIENKRVTPETHFQDVRLFDLRLARPYDYGPGAVAVVFPKNFPEDIQQFIELMNWTSIADMPLNLAAASDSIAGLSAPSPLRQIDLTKIRLTLRWLLENALDIMAIPRRSFFANLVHFASTETEDQAYQKERLLELANPELIDELWDYTTRPKRTILEVMMDFTTIKIPWQYAVTTLPIMRGRQFSIASGGELTKDEAGHTRVQLLVAIVDPPSPIIKWRRRYGVCTRYMTQLEAGQQICVQMQPGYLDVKPDETSNPVVLIGPGTGVAPMRSMIYARQQWAKQLGAELPADMLFFGCRSAKADNFFAEEWSRVSKKLQVVTAFSRDDQQPKQYVQDQIRAKAEIVARTLLEEQGRVYICGSSGNMPKGVRAALTEAFLTHPTLSDERAAEQAIEMMEKAGRLKQETW